MFWKRCCSCASGRRHRVGRHSFGASPGTGGKAQAGNVEKAAKAAEIKVDVLPLPYATRSKPTFDVPQLGYMWRNVPATTAAEVTTAVTASASGPPHLGHAFSLVLADVFTRFERMLGKTSVLHTFSREHGGKMALLAEKIGLAPAQLSDVRFEELQCLKERLTIADARPVRTTGLEHKAFAQDLWQRCEASGDIYLDSFNGWYNTREDRFIDEAEALAIGFVDALSGEALLRLQQPCYFFRLSRYAERLRVLFEERPDFLRPESSLLDVIQCLKTNGLRDVPITRMEPARGLRSPYKGHVLHVGFESLAQVAYGMQAEPHSSTSDHWLGDLHVVCKDQIWQQAVVWPAVLMSARLPLPRCIWTHGIVMGMDDRPMRYWLGNALSPHDLLDAIPADTLRWYFARAELADSRFCIAEMKRLHDEELRLLSNIVHRATTLAARFSGGQVPTVEASGSEPFNVKELRLKFEDAMRFLQLQLAAATLVNATAATEDWLTALVAGGQLGKMDEGARQSMIRVLLEAVFALAHLYAAFTPTLADAIASKFNAPLRSLSDFNSFDNLPPGCSVTSGSVLLKPLELLEVASDVAMPWPLTGAPSIEPLHVVGSENAPKNESSITPAPPPESCPKGRRLPDGLHLYLAHQWPPGILIRRVDEEDSMGDHQMVDERNEYAPLLEEIAFGDQCLDMGGHIGTLAVAMAEAAPNVHVLTVEPDPDSAAVLSANLLWRGLEDRVVLLPGALRTIAAASTPLYRTTLNSSISSCVPIHGRESVIVPVVTVADLLRRCHSSPCIAKVDIEGGEYEVLPHLLIACPDLRLLALELHFTKRVFQIHLAPALEELLELIGFHRLGGRQRSRQGVAELTFWSRAADAPRVPCELLPSLLALWRHTYAGCTERLAKQAGVQD